MLKPPMPNVAGMTDTLDFVKNLWGSMNVPGVGGMTGAALSTDELDKKIADLKAVESWLNLNTNMLRTTIQAMEVQRGTIATLKSMSESMAQAMRQPGADEQAGAAAPASPFGSFFTQPGAAAAQPGAAAPEPAAAALPAAMAWWNLLQEQFKQAVASTMSPEAMASAAALAQDAAAQFGMGAEGQPAPATPGEGGPAKSATGKAPKADKS